MESNEKQIVIVNGTSAPIFVETGQKKIKAQSKKTTIVMVSSNAEYINLRRAGWKSILLQKKVSVALNIKGEITPITLTDFKGGPEFVYAYKHIHNKNK